MKIDNHKLDEMFRVAGVDKKQLYDVLRKMGRKAIKTKEMKDGWSEDNPTYCTCYFVTEWFYYYGAPLGSKPYAVKVPGDPGLHRFVKTPYGYVIDLTAEQFSNYEDVDYSAGKPSYFLQTGRKGPSARARKIQELLGYDPDEWVNPKEIVEQDNDGNLIPTRPYLKLSNDELEKRYNFWKKKFDESNTDDNSQDINCRHAYHQLEQYTTERAMRHG